MVEESNHGTDSIGRVCHEVDVVGPVNQMETAESEIRQSHVDDKSLTETPFPERD